MVLRYGRFAKCSPNEANGSRPNPFRFAPRVSLRSTRATKKKKKSEAKRRQTQRSFAVPDEHGRASSVRRTSIGVPPRLLLRRPNATAQLQSALPGMGPVSGRYPQTGPSQYSEAPRRPVVLPVGRVPEAARERVASPPAGTALALAARNASRPRPNIGRDSELYVTEMGTNVNDAVT